jgi:cellulose synthase/poly-beta-1,6-N-acetylglucosamine synthase-like glycosyltransferase
VNVVKELLVAYSLASFAFYALLNALYVVLSVLAWRAMAAEVRGRRYLALEDVFRSPMTPGISVLVPAYNESAVIVESVRSLLALRYPRHEVIVASDGSTDGTIDVLMKAFDLVPIRKAMHDDVETAPIRATYSSRRHPNLVVIDKDNGGRSDALNAALNVARQPYVCVIDADSLLEDDALLKVSKPILENPQVLAATGGTIRVANNCVVDHGRVIEARLPKNRLATIQVLEYFRAFLVGRVGWSRINALAIISGAFGLFNRSLIETVGGYSTKTVGEDFELTLRLHQYLRERDEAYRIMFIPDPVCWTEVPEQISTLGRQRRRWQRGLWEGIRDHRRMLFNPRYGIIGLLAMPYFAVFEFLSPAFGLIGLVLTIGLWVFGVISTAYFVLFMLISLGLGLLLSISALVIEELSFRRYRKPRELVRLLAYAVLENFGYHQIHDVWRGLGYIDIMRGTKGWGVQQRRGFAAPVADES